MSTAGRVRRRATVRWAGEPGAVAWAGAKALPHAWPMLAAHFRDVLLAPRRLDDDAGVEWVWTEAAERAEASAAECAALRRRLAAGVELFGEWAEAEAARADGRTKKNGGERAESVRATAAWVEAWNRKPDTEARRWIARTEHGWRLHSWGATAAADVEAVGAGRTAAPAADDGRSGATTAEAREAAASGGESGLRRRDGGGRRRGAWWWAAAMGGLVALGAGAGVAWNRQAPGAGAADRKAAETDGAARDATAGREQRSSAATDGRPTGERGEWDRTRVTTMGPPAEAARGPRVAREGADDDARSAGAERQIGEPRARDGVATTATGAPGENRARPASAQAAAAGARAGAGGTAGAQAGAGAGGAGAGGAGAGGVAAARATAAGAEASADMPASAHGRRDAEGPRRPVQGVLPEESRSPLSEVPGDRAIAATEPRARGAEQAAENLDGSRRDVVRAAVRLPEPEVAERRFRDDPGAGHARIEGEDGAVATKGTADQVDAAATGEAATRRGDPAAQDAEPRRGNAASGGRRTDAAAGFAKEQFVRPVRWEVRLIEDEIVPTQPRLAGETDDAGEVRARVWAERVAGRPASLREVAVRQGVAWRSDAGAAAEAWTVRARTASFTVTTDGARTEAAWRDWPARGEHWTAEAGARKVGGEVEADGTLWWRTTDGVRAWRWVEFTLAAEAGWSPRRWRWQLLSGADLPPGARASIEADGRARIEWPLEADAAAMALAERTTGWAVVVFPVGGQDAPR